MDFLRFENVEISGYLNNDSVSNTTKINYLFNQSTACDINALTFTNCSVHNFGNSVVRLQQASSIKTIDTLTFDGCIIYDVGYTSVYGIVNTNVAGSIISNITFTNCTVYNFAGPLVLHTSGSSNSVALSYCTFNYITTSGTSGTTIRYFIDYSSNDVTDGVTVKNCIFGSTPRAYSEGIRVSSNTNKTISGSYYTSDYDDNNATTTYSIIGSLTAYSGSSTTLFVSPLTGDFNFKDETFAGRNSVGDSRWWADE